MASDILTSPAVSSKFIAENAVEVEICLHRIPGVAKQIMEEFSTSNISLSDWKMNDLHPHVADIAAIDWIFFVDALNFCFWNEKSDAPFTVKYNGTSHSGVSTLCSCVQRALEEGIPLTDPKYFVDITLDVVERVFRSDNGTKIPLLEERQRILRECGEILIKKFGGSFSNCVQLCDKSAQKLLHIIVENFPSFKDEAIYLGQKVAFYKRAQILIADIWACFEGKDLGYFEDIDTLTMFADYRVPQVLCHFGVLKYSEALFKKLKSEELLESKSNDEMEIRGCCIWATELLVNEMRKLASQSTGKCPAIINSVVVDFFLWGYRRKHAAELEAVPFHRVRSIYY